MNASEEPETPEETRFWQLIEIGLQRLGALNATATDTGKTKAA